MRCREVGAGESLTSKEVSYIGEVSHMSGGICRGSELGRNVPKWGRGERRKLAIYKRDCGTAKHLEAYQELGFTCKPPEFCELHV